MTPPLGPEQAAAQSLFYKSDTPQAMEMMRKLEGKTLEMIRKSHNGILLKFSEEADYLMLLGGKIPVFGMPVPTDDPEVMEMPLDGFYDIVVVSLSGGGMQPDQNFWAVWNDVDAQSLVGMVLTGYSPSKSILEDESEYPSAMLEFNINLYLVVTPINVYLMKRNKELAIS